MGEARVNRSRVGVGVPAIELAFGASSCSWTSGDQYFVHWGVGRDDVIVRQRTSWDLTLARDLFFNNNDVFADRMGGFSCHADRSANAATKCVMRLLNKQTDISGLASGIWSRSTDSTEGVVFDDFNGAFGRIRSSADDKAQLSDCLTLSVYPHTRNWTERDQADTNCRQGLHVWE